MNAEHKYVKDESMISTAAKLASKDFNRRILVIDDNESILNDFKKVLTYEKQDELEQISRKLFGEDDDQVKTPGHSTGTIPSFEVEATRKGEEGYEWVKASIKKHRPYALVFVDMRMPRGWDGMQTIKKLWKVDPNLEIVICTAYSDHTWEELVSDLPHQDQLLLLKKPFDSVEVCQLSMSLTEKWNLSQTARLKMSDMEALVEEKTAEVVKANAVRSNFLNILGHEFLTPLNGVLGFAQIVRSQLDETHNNQLVSDIKYIEICGERLRFLINDLLDVVRSTSGEIDVSTTSVIPKQLIDNAVDNFSRLSEDPLITVDIDEEIGKVLADNERFKQIMMNLLHNAQRFTRPTDPINIRCVKNQDMARFEVIDQGPGLNQEAISQILMPIEETAKNRARIAYSDNIAEEGLGMGLALAKHLVELQSGTLGIDSSPGQGTCAWFTLPLDKAI